jgi:hypothetical protein
MLGVPSVSGNIAAAIFRVNTISIIFDETFKYGDGMKF